MTGKIHATSMSKSFTGFDEIAIRQRFGTDLEELSSTMLTRAILFVVHRRDGVKDAEAYSRSMLVPIGELADLFADEPSEPEDPMTPGSQTS
jgi:hypothetical protein